MPDTSDAPNASRAKPPRNAIGMPEPERGQPVEPRHPGKPIGERQDGPGAAPSRPERSEATPVGGTHARRAGSDAVRTEEPDSDSAGGGGRETRFSKRR